MSRLNNIRSFLKKADTVAIVVVALLLLVVVPIFIMNGYVKTPEFLLLVKDGLVNDRLVIDSIGEPRGYTVEYNQVKVDGVDKIKFAIVVDGYCDSSYAKVRGVYYKRNGKYVIEKSDTVIVNKCK